MNRLSRFLLGLSLAVTFGCMSAAAQESSPPLPKILQITREHTKPGKAGMAHDRTESLFVQAMTRAKWPTHYLGMTSLSGKQRAIFLTHYDSFEAWEKDNIATEKDATLSAPYVCLANFRIADSSSSIGTMRSRPHRGVPGWS